MDQLTFKFPFSKKYFEQDFFISKNNFEAYKLIESWPTWPGKWVNIFGDPGSGKTHLAKILEKKINKIRLVEANNVNDELIQELNNIDCLIIDNYENDINEKLFYSILNHSIQLDNFILINSTSPIRNIKFNLNDLRSRIQSFIFIGIDLPVIDE